MPVRDHNWRYIWFTVNANAKISITTVLRKIQKTLLYLYGVKGLSEINPVLIEYHGEAKEGIIRCRLVGLRRMRASLAYIIKINGVKASINVSDVSGTLKNLRKRNTMKKDDCHD
jgi:RNase P/RNase MRP subunit POP5